MISRFWLIWLVAITVSLGLPDSAQPASNSYLDGAPNSITQGAAGSSAWPFYAKPLTGTGAYPQVNVGTSSSVIVAASTATTFIDITNVSATATVILSIGGTPTITGTQGGGTGGLISLPPGWHKSFPDPAGGYLPTDAISAISSAASTPVTVGVK